MSAELAVRARLLAAAPVSALVATRIYQLKLPQKPTLPAVRVQLVDAPVGYHLRGADGALRARVQVDAYQSEAAPSDPYAALVTLADAIDAAVSGQVFAAAGVQVTGVLRTSRRVIYEAEELRLLRCLQDFTVWWRAA